MRIAMVLVYAIGRLPLYTNDSRLANGFTCACWAALVFRVFVSGEQAAVSEMLSVPTSCLP